MASSSSSSSFSNSIFFQVMMKSCMTWIKRLQCFFHVGFIACTSRDLFIAIEMEEGGGHFVDPINGV